MNEEPLKPSNPRARVPKFVKIPKFCTAKDVQKILDVKAAFPKMLWHEVVADVIETNIDEESRNS